MASSKNSEYQKTSFLSKSNSAFIEQMYLKFINRESDLPESWEKYFLEIGEEFEIIAKEINGPSWNPIKKKINLVKKYEFGKATLVIAIPDPWIDVQTVADLEEIAFEFRDKKKKKLRVATKYPNLTKEFLFSKGVTQFQLVESLGATEAYPFTGSANLITDISSTGETIKSNNLRVLKDGEILKSQACIFTSKKNFKKKGLKALVKLLTK